MFPAFGSWGQHSCVVGSGAWLKAVTGGDLEGFALVPSPSIPSQLSGFLAASTVPLSGWSCIETSSPQTETVSQNKTLFLSIVHVRNLFPETGK